MVLLRVLRALCDCYSKLWGGGLMVFFLSRELAGSLGVLGLHMAQLTSCSRFDLGNPTVGYVEPIAYLGTSACPATNL